MPDSMTARGPARETTNEPGEDFVTDVESRSGVASLDTLHRERRELIERNGRLIALFGPFGHHDDHRKRFVEAEKVQARVALSAQSEKKPTEAQIDSEAYGSAA